MVADDKECLRSLAKEEEKAEVPVESSRRGTMQTIMMLFILCERMFRSIHSCSDYKSSIKGRDD
jgi:hypothetical protein